MKKSIYLFVLALLACLNSFAQAPKFKFGKVSLDELQKSKYEIDTTADAIILYDKANINFGYEENYGFFISTEITTRKKILKSSALQDGIIDIPYIRLGGTNDEIISNVEAFIYNIENGIIVKSELSKKSIFEEKITTKYYNKKLSLPNVKVGSIIEYTFVRKTPINLRDKPKTWYFQNEEPTLWSQLEFAVPSHFSYKRIVGGYLPLEINNYEKENFSYGVKELNTYGTRYIMAVKNAPAFKNEPFVASSKDYVSKVEFELSSFQFPNQQFHENSFSWPGLDKSLNESEDFGKKIKKTTYLKGIIKNFAGLTNDKEKLEKLYHYFNTNFEPIEDYNDIWPGDLKTVFENKKGTASELNIIFLSLLRELGYKANPVILSTRDNGKINPSMAINDKFNYVITQVNINDEKINLDITSPVLPFGMLPINCLNQTGRIIYEDGTGEFIDLTPVQKLKEYTIIEAKIEHKTGDLIGSYLNNGAGYYSFLTRKEYKEVGEQKFIENIKGKNEDWDLTNLSLENFKDPESVAIIKYNFKKKNEEEEISEIIYIEPILTNKRSSNPFKNNSREYPIDFGYTQDETYKLILEIPEFYEVTSLPKNLNLKIENDGGMFTYAANYDVNTKKITILSRINLKNTIYSADQYLHLKEFYSKIVEKHNEQIVLKRTNHE